MTSSARCGSAVAGHVLVTTADGAYAFRHALMREAVYARLLPAERVRLHGEIGRAIDAHRAMSGETDPQLLADLAYHWYCAGNQPRAFAAAVEAGLAADDIYAHAEALAQYERVLQLWDSVESPSSGRAWTGSASARAPPRRRATAASPARAVRLIEEAIDGVDPDAEPARAGLLGSASDATAGSAARPPTRSPPSRRRSGSSPRRRRRSSGRGCSRRSPTHS